MCAVRFQPPNPFREETHVVRQRKEQTGDLTSEYDPKISSPEIEEVEIPFSRYLRRIGARRIITWN